MKELCAPFEPQNAKDKCDLKMFETVRRPLENLKPFARNSQIGRLRFERLTKACCKHWICRIINGGNEAYEEADQCAGC